MRLLRYFLPWQVIVRPRGAAVGEVEIKNRKSGGRLTLPVAQALAKLGAKA
ncbi:hypothetical protein J1C56_10925 [Aminobacter anthyllidis]|uniref:Uncharacterized protein n=1 Tax=Aminobacter anthyllidis TaxID=1035067 RepID=A0A9X1AA94_9HYPH|nr:hypothetical protein [Aminobacter anthyllidis]MBT1156104.1 hypothetical protein [Aminobacter anthyllidis]